MKSHWSQLALRGGADNPPHLFQIWSSRLALAFGFTLLACNLTAQQSTPVAAAGLPPSDAPAGNIAPEPSIPTDQPAGTTSTDSKPTDTRAKWKRAYTEARNYFAAGLDEKGVAVLDAVNPRKAGSMARQMVNAQMLVRLATEFSSSGLTTTSDRVIQLALKQIETVVSSASKDENDLAADALELAGFVKLRFLGNPSGARASYRQALLLFPLNTAAKAALGRLDQTDAVAASKGQSNTGSQTPPTP